MPGHTGLWATSDEILVKAGENYDTSISEARINALCLQAESHINCETNKVWTAAIFTALNSGVKYLLAEAESNLVAMYIINYNPSVFASRVEAETMVDILTERYMACMTLLKDINVQTFMVNA